MAIKESAQIRDDGGVVLHTYTEWNKDVTLTDDIANYSKVYIEIWSYPDGSITPYTLINPSGRTMAVSTGNGDQSGASYFINNHFKITFNGTTVSRRDVHRTALINGRANDVSNDESFYKSGIGLIVGYK